MNIQHRTFPSAQCAPVSLISQPRQPQEDHCLDFLHLNVLLVQDFIYIKSYRIHHLGSALLFSSEITSNNSLKTKKMRPNHIQ